MTGHRPLEGQTVVVTRATSGIGDMTLDQWSTARGVDLTGPFLCLREAAPR